MSAISNMYINDNSEEEIIGNWAYSFLMEYNSIIDQKSLDKQSKENKK